MCAYLSHWRSSERYGYIEHLASSELAWEWLRRNDDYRHDFEAVQDDFAADTVTVEAVTLKWGLQFLAVT